MNYKQLTTRYPYCILFFSLLIICGHFIYQWIAFDIMKPIMSLEITLLIQEVKGALYSIGIPYRVEGTTFYITSVNQTYGYMSIEPVCTSMRGLLYWCLVIILTSGSWKHKLWYLLSGIILIQLVNAIRITTLGLVLYYTTDRYNFYHGLFENMVYVVIFVLWVLWIEKANRVIINDK